MVVLALSRWPGLMPDNFSAVYAIAFCAGVYLRGAMRWWLPLVTLLICDLAINFHYRAEYLANPEAFTEPITLFPPYLLANYLGYGALLWLGTRFKPRARWYTLVGGGILGALLFYLFSNTGAWLSSPGYAKSLAGWVQALTVGLPGYPPTWVFLLKTLTGTGLFTGLFVGALRLGTKQESKDADTADEAEPAEDGRSDEAGANA